MNTLVSFEVAKLLKEKGFDEPCTTIVTEEGTYHIVTGTTSVMMNGIRYTVAKNSILPDHIKSAPTIAEIIMWLYGKHRIWIQAYPRRYDDLKLMWTYSLIAIEDGYTIDGIEFPNIDNPEDIPVWGTTQEACLEAIKYTLDNLIK